MTAEEAELSLNTSPEKLPLLESVVTSNVELAFGKEVHPYVSQRSKPPLVGKSAFAVAVTQQAITIPRRLALKTRTAASFSLSCKS